MSLVHVYSPGVREDDQRETWRFLATLPGCVTHWPTSEPDDYERILIALWQRQRPFLLLEQDVVPTAAMLDALVACPHPICVQACPIYPVSSNLPKAVIACAVHTPGERRWVRDGEAWADEAGLPCIKLSAAIQRLIPANELEPSSMFEHWWTLDRRLSRAMMARGIRFHVHWPQATHHHR